MSRGGQSFHRGRASSREGGLQNLPQSPCWLLPTVCASFTLVFAALRAQPRPLGRRRRLPVVIFTDSSVDQALASKTASDDQRPWLAPVCTRHRSVWNRRHPRVVHTRQLPREGTKATSPASGSSLSKGFIRWRLQVSLCKVDHLPRGVTGCATPGTPNGSGTSRRPGARRPAVCQEQVNSSTQGVVRPVLGTRTPSPSTDPGSPTQALGTSNLRLKMGSNPVNLLTLRSKE